MLVLALLCYPCLAGAAAYVVDSSNSAAWFEVHYWGNSVVKGKLSLQQGRVELDEGGRGGRGEISFDMNSVQTGRDFVNDFIKSKRIFDAATFPSMTFKPNRFEFQGERMSAAEGELNLHGVTRTVRLEVKRFLCQDVLAALLFDVSNVSASVDTPLPSIGRAYCYGEFTTQILRSQFGMDSMTMMVNDEVNISANLVLQKVIP
ncbi:MAG: YceI family protein [Burkholderiales bacterium]|nr:YceI family protein [Burkholderiales bacterium]